MWKATFSRCRMVWISLKVDISGVLSWTFPSEEILAIMSWSDILVSWYVFEAIILQSVDLKIIGGRRMVLGGLEAPTEFDFLVSMA